MVEFSLTKKGTFVLGIVGLTVVLFWLSGNNSSAISRVSDSGSLRVVSMRAVFVAGVTAVEQGGAAIRGVRESSALETRTKAIQLKIDDTGLTQNEVITQADLVSNQCIIQRFSRLSTDILVSPARSSLLVGQTGHGDL